ncbi:MAG: CaiB/BaiF CoA-transferase family protein [Hydrogenophaga sp.]|uniref:CaiB/BaiF CoA transferase family protein n=1 Tax=Hydrogenophaga sp. TaxID=1904254 RepID=UPI002730E3F2|nr:CaiB/BaiF CoA-transferase family protein [Hydrogenophaga sp.]MDP2164707.1 CaiB/BaiF CoA-transferase family protein [Hydrogenophaga sp.]
MSKSLPLAGVRVVEFVHVVMGPTCGLILADLGAEVIKVEPLDGDHTRKLVASGAGFFPTYNRNKKSFAVDLKSPQGREAVLKLIASADVITENFRPGAMDKLGFGYAALKQVKSDLIYCSLKGFLPGPYDHRTGLDEVVQMMGGLAYMTGGRYGPLRAGASVNDVMGGMFGAIAILAALHQRQGTRKGQHVQSALFENNAFLMAQHMMEGLMTGKPVTPMPDRVRAWAIYDNFKTSDGEPVFVGVVTDTQWKIFCAAFGLADLLDDPALATNPQRVEARPRILPIVTAIFSKMSKQALMDKCESLGLPFAPIAKPEDLFEDPHLNASGGLTPVTLLNGEKTKVPVLPIEMDGARFGTRLDVPRIGEHTREVLAGLGYDAATIRQLIADKVMAVTD